MAVKSEGYFRPDSDNGKAASGQILHYCALKGIFIHYCCFIQIMNLDGVAIFIRGRFFGDFEGWTRKPSFTGKRDKPD